MGFLSKFAPQILGVLRIVVGLLFLEHGLVKIVGFPAPDGRPPSTPDHGGRNDRDGRRGIDHIGPFQPRRRVHHLGRNGVRLFSRPFSEGLVPDQNGGDAAILFCFIFLYLAAAGPGAFAVNQK